MLFDLRQCPCGSGLRLARRCQLRLTLGPPPEASLPLLAIVDAAAEGHSQGAIEEAERSCLEVLGLAPTQLDALSLLYRIRKDAGNQSAADALLRRIVQVHPNTLWATYELAAMLFGRGAIADAELHARNAVRIAPENPQSHNLLAMVTTQANRPQISEYHYRQVIELSHARDPILLANLAWNLKNQGRMAEARELYEESSAAAPEVMQTWLGWARMEEADRNFERAAELLDRAEQLEPRNPSVMLSRAVLYGRTGSYSQALAILDAAGATSDGGLGPNELLEKGRLLDRIGRYDEAFAAFAEGKRLCREVSGLGYLQQPAEQLAARLKGFFTEGRVAILPRAALRSDVAQPIFVLGFP